MKEIKAWVCSYCNKVYRSKQYCKKHEIECLQNPEVKNCYACENFYFANVGCDLFGCCIKEHGSVLKCVCFADDRILDYLTENQAVNCEDYEQTDDRIRKPNLTYEEIKEYAKPWQLTEYGKRELRKKQLIKDNYY